MKALQWESMPYYCFKSHYYIYPGAMGALPDRNASSPTCNQPGCGVSHMCYAMSIFWMVCEGQGCLSVLGCLRLQILEV